MIVDAREPAKPKPFRYWKPEVLTTRFVASIIVLAAQRGFDLARQDLDKDFQDGIDRTVILRAYAQSQPVENDYEGARY